MLENVPRLEEAMLSIISSDGRRLNTRDSVLFINREDPIRIYISRRMTSLLELENCSMFYLAFLPVHSGSLKRIQYPKNILGH